MLPLFASSRSLSSRVASPVVLGLCWPRPRPPRRDCCCVVDPRPLLALPLLLVRLGRRLVSGNDDDFGVVPDIIQRNATPRSIQSCRIKAVRSPKSLPITAFSNNESNAFSLLNAQMPARSSATKHKCLIWKMTAIVDFSQNQICIMELALVVIFWIIELDV
jgi:hypothetical protein